MKTNSLTQNKLSVLTDSLINKIICTSDHYPKLYGNSIMFKAIISALFALVFIGGCTVTPDPLSLADLRSVQETRAKALMIDQEPVTQSISLHEAMARAIKYNLDYKVEMFSEALRTSELDLSRSEMLPMLVASAGLNNRDTHSSSRSSSLLDSDVLTAPSESATTSTERNVIDSDIRLSWDILDFGLSYVRAKQSADQVLIANERKRKVINRVIANVRTAYWRAVSAERLVDRLRSFEVDIEQALTSSEESYKQRKTAPLAALTYQRELLEIQQEINAMEGEMRLAKMQLAALMNINPSSDYRLEIPDRTDLPSIVLNSDKLVETALLNRPELRELTYEQRINQKQAQSALLEVLPSLSLFGGVNYNSNDYLLHNNWVSWGTQASWNIFNAFKYPAKKRVVDVNGEYLDQRALALTMAILTQVHVSASQFKNSERKLNTNRRFQRVSDNILEQISAGHEARKVSYQTFVREKMNHIIADAKYDVAYADLQNSLADLFTAVGQPVYGNIDVSQSSVKELAEHLRTYWKKLNSQLESK